MLIRLVRMHFAPENTETFRKIFEETAPFIMEFSGCLKVEILTDATDPNIIYTLSHWQALENLETYRTSAFFKQTWTKVKPLFNAKTQAFSMLV